MFFDTSFGVIIDRLASMAAASSGGTAWAVGAVVGACMPPIGSAMIPWSSICVLSK